MANENRGRMTMGAYKNRIADRKAREASPGMPTTAKMATVAKEATSGMPTTAARTVTEAKEAAYGMPTTAKMATVAKEATSGMPTTARTVTEVKPIELTAEKPTDRMKEITDRLEQGIKDLFNSAKYTEYLRVMSKFHDYSLNNTLLIAMQKPDASLVAGFTSWKNNFGRTVMKGQKGIKIFAPCPHKARKEVPKIDPVTKKPVIGKDGNPEKEIIVVTVPAYKIVSVFDISQTEGRPLPELQVDELTGNVDHFADFFTAIEKTSPVTVGFEDIPGEAHGYYHLEDKRIAIQAGMGELQTLKTAIHEIAHAKLHDVDLNAPPEEQNRVDSRTREVEAESIAYTVCQHYGLDTSDYSFGYIAGWSSGRSTPELKGSLETIRSTAAEIIHSIDDEMKELQKDRSKERGGNKKHTGLVR